MPLLAAPDRATAAAVLCRLLLEISLCLGTQWHACIWCRFRSLQVSPSYMAIKHREAAQMIHLASGLLCLLLVAVVWPQGLLYECSMLPTCCIVNKRCADTTIHSFQAERSALFHHHDEFQHAMKPYRVNGNFFSSASALAWLADHPLFILAWVFPCYDATYVLYLRRFEKQGSVANCCPDRQPPGCGARECFVNSAY